MVSSFGVAYPNLHLISLPEVSGYGMKDIVTDQEGKAYIWLPANTLIRQIGSDSEGVFSHFNDVFEPETIIMQANDDNAGKFYPGHRLAPFSGNLGLRRRKANPVFIWRNAV